ncbi:histone-lysine N-methyltransferase SETMAR [Trichonephila clavipes]|nr:histone-lysine N-methyltransferase SETMAR [Trichonephila clavipes]
MQNFKTRLDDSSTHPNCSNGTIVSGLVSQPMIIVTINWHRIVFREKFCFTLEAEDHHLCVWRGRGQRSQSAFVFQKHSTITPDIFALKDALCTGRPIVKNVDKTTDKIEVDRYVSSPSITQKLKIDHKTVLSHLRKVGFKKKLHLWMPH